ncbi:cal-1 [Symbiodinium sp. CCMP2456]|nr:cal-1 [Symbiodinium sp. CCMP2456]
MQTAAEVAFWALDVDEDGLIGRDEFALSMIGLLSRDLAQSLFESLDLDGDGAIDLQEFLWMTQALSETDIEYAFSFFDVNGDGHVSKKDLRAFFSQRGLIREAEIDDMIRALDADGSSTIDQKEFSSWLLGVISGGVAARAPTVEGPEAPKRGRKRRAKAAVARRNGAIQKFISTVCLAGAVKHWEATILCQSDRELPMRPVDHPLSKREKFERLHIMSERRIQDLEAEVRSLRAFVRHLRDSREETANDPETPKPLNPKPV